MPAYEYTALNATGRKQKGVLQGDSESDIRRQLRANGCVPIEVTPSRHNTPTKKSNRFAAWFLKNRQRLSKKERALITRQLATLLSATMPIDEALDCLARQQKKTSLKSLLLAIRSSVTDGNSLGDALAFFPQAFPPIYQATIASAEKTGQLAQVLSHLAQYTEKQTKLQQHIQQALIYPAVMLCVSLGVVIFLLVNIVPTILQIFIDSKQSLPVATQWLMKITHLIQHDGLLLLGGVIALSIATVHLLKQKKWLRRLHRILLSLPILGNTIGAINSARFARSLGILQQASVPILEALHTSAALIKPLPMHDAVSHALTRVRDGKGIAESLDEAGVFSPMLIYLIQSGEKSGALAEMLDKAASMQEDEAQTVIQTALTLFEPFMIIFMGGVVLFIVLAVMLPIFSLDQMAG